MTKDEAKDVAHWLDEAADNIRFWGDYATDFFQHKHGLNDIVELFKQRAEEVRKMGQSNDSKHQEKREEGKSGALDKGRRSKSSQ